MGLSAIQYNVKISTLEVSDRTFKFGRSYNYSINDTAQFELRQAFSSSYLVLFIILVSYYHFSSKSRYLIGKILMQYDFKMIFEPITKLTISKIKGSIELPVQYFLYWTNQALI